MKLDVIKKSTKNHGSIVAIACININSREPIIVVASSHEKSLFVYDSHGKFVTESSLNIRSYITSLSWQSSSYISTTTPSTTSKHIPKGDYNNTILAVSCTDGTLLLLKTKANYISNTTSPSNTSVDNTLSSLIFSETQEIKAHSTGGAITSLKWNHEGTSLATGGEDGKVIIWSRTGNLRSNLASFDKAVQSMAWGPDNESLLIAHGHILTIIHAQAQTDTIEWVAMATKTPHNNSSQGRVILAVNWSESLNLILSGGDDGVYRIFDCNGLNLYTCPTALSHPITSLSWSPSTPTSASSSSDTLFTIGSFNKLILCNKVGSIQDIVELTNESSVLGMQWSSDGTQVFAACGNGSNNGSSLVSANLIGKKCQLNGMSAELIESSRIRLIYGSCLQDDDIVDISSGPIVDFVMEYDKLVVVTRTHYHVYNLQDIYKPITFPIKESTMRIRMISLSDTKFVSIGEPNDITIYTYDGRIVSSVKYNGMMTHKLYSHGMFSLSDDTFAIIDQNDCKTILIFDCKTGQPYHGCIDRIIHEVNVNMIQLSKTSSNFSSSSNMSHSTSNFLDDQRLAFLDCKNELFISPVKLSFNPTVGRTNSTKSSSLAIQQDYFTSLIYKLGSQIYDMKWNDKCNSLVTLNDNRLTLYCYPNAPYVDVDLLPMTICILVQDVLNTFSVGRCSTRSGVVSGEYDVSSSNRFEGMSIQNFTENKVILQRFDGVQIPVMVPNDPTPLYSMVLNSMSNTNSSSKSIPNGWYNNDKKWREVCLRYCRSYDTGELWATLACLALEWNDWEIAETAFMSLQAVDKVNYIRNIRKMSGVRQRAEMLLYLRRPEEAIASLLETSPPQLYRAIKTNIHLFRWREALALAVQSSSTTNMADNLYVEVTLRYRAQYLRSMGKKGEEDIVYRKLFNEWIRQHSNIHDNDTAGKNNDDGMLMSRLGKLNFFDKNRLSELKKTIKSKEEEEE